MKFLTCVVVLLCLTVLVVDGFKKGEKGRSKRDEDTKQRRKDSNKPAGELKVDVTVRNKSKHSNWCFRNDMEKKKREQNATNL